ncbi:hypothetical protein [Thiobacillus sedimenti]|uniref:ATP-binding protein n=1 Tax=Thiobacillus sedimenti TaxID=3110231 RepID=A0ABZ1CKF7_9PROT|nr:hypothetical protein [Thiobacillus sp. SCUT-2]WRS38772.1 hypothetical protein VA613_12290 [Thiobacillus sp. SCUT-2]
MDTTLNEIVVHVDEPVDETLFAELERGIRQDRGVVSVGRHPGREHLMVVVYDADVARASTLLHTFQERGLHAQLIGM